MPRTIEYDEWHDKDKLEYHYRLLWDYKEALWRENEALDKKYDRAVEILDSMTLKSTPKPEPPEELPGLTDEAKAIIYNKEN